jgi:thiol-disulfide isomerase/thioredoxin
MLENAEINMSGNVTASETNGATTYNFESVKVERSPMTDLYKQKISVRDTLDKMYVTNGEKHKVISSLVGQARQSKDQAKMDSLMNTDAYKALNADEKAFFDAVNTTYNKLYLDNKDSFWGPLMMICTMTYFTEDQKEVYEQFSQQAKDSYYGKLVKDELYPPSFIGKPVPEFTVNSKDGEKTLAQLRNSKKYILVDFWASWCGPCRKEIPNLKKIYSQYASKGFEIVSISTDKKVDDWQKALAEEKLPWPNFRDEAGIADQYGVKFIPAMFLLDANGVLIAENIRGEELANKLNELFTN